MTTAARVPVHAPAQGSTAARPASPGVRLPAAASSNQATQRALLSDVQTKLRVSEAGDAYEQEADRIAERVMQMGPPASSAERVTPVAVSHLQRQNIEEEGEDEEEEELTLQRKPRPERTTAVAPSLEARVRASSQGGEPLPAATRRFFEDRLGRDLGGVRVHTGAQAAELNEAIRARAFAHRNHVWLGAGENVEPSHVLAHELVHCLQQTAAAPTHRQGRPGAIASHVGSEHDDDSGPRGHVAVSATPAEPALIQRFEPYWEPGDYNGTRTHNVVLPAISQHGQVFVEAPVPNADAISADYGKRGAADIYQADTTVGLYFLASQAPVALSAPRRLRHNGARFAHRSRAAPRVDGVRNAIRVDQAPPSILVGDLKPSHGTIEALEGESQVRNYLAGFRLAANEVNELADHHRTTPADSRWNPGLDLLSQAQLNALVPPQYQLSSSSPASRLVLKQNGRPIRPLTFASGRLVLEADPGNQGILNYVWVPQPPPSLSTPANLRTLDNAVRTRIVAPLRRPPVKASIRETFELGPWRTERRRIRREYRAFARTPEGTAAKTAELVAEAHRASEKATHLNLPDPGGETAATAQSRQRLEFWTGTPAGILGTFRRLFGRAFVRIADAYEGMRSRFRNQLRRTPSPSGGGLPGAAIKAAFSVLKMAGVFIVSRTLTLLSESLVGGITRKLATLIPEENIAELSTRVEEAQRLYEELRDSSIKTAEDIVEHVLPGFLATTGRIQEIAAVVSGLTRMINLVRWGIRAIACVSPPAVGCLWALGEAALSELAAVVVRSCWFQTKFGALLLRIDSVRELMRELPRAFAGAIIGGVRGLLPSGLHDVFADVASRAPRPEEIECDEADGPGRELTDDQRAILELQERLGEERFVALMALIRRSDAPAGVPLDRAAAEQIGAVIEEQALTAEDLRLLAERPRRARGDLARFLRQLRRERERSPVEPVMPEPEYRTVVVGSRAGRGDAAEPARNEGEGEAGARERVDVRTADAQPTDAAPGTPLTGRTIERIAVRGSMQPESIVRIDFRMTHRQDGRRVVRVLRNLEVRVVEVVPSESDDQRMEAFLEVVRDQEFVFPEDEAYMYREGTEFTHAIGAP